MDKEFLELKEIEITLSNAEIQGNGISQTSQDNNFNLYLDELSL